MGVVRLFYWLYNNYPEVLTVLKETKTFEDEKIDIDSYALDLNAIIHPVCQKMYNYGGSKSDFKPSRLLHKKKTFVPDEKQVFSELCKVIEAFRVLVNPRKEFFIAIDGIAGLSKSTQMRGRRFKSASERDEKQSFDSAKITTGTEFMYNLSRYIHVFIQRQLENNPKWKYLEVIFANEKVVGEGEHKIIRYIDKNRHKNMSYCVHSPDADLIMLQLGLNMPNMYILRENIYTDIDCKYFIVDVNKFKNVVLKSLKWSSSEKHKYTVIQTIYDFILLCFLLGNDFLPHIPSLEISNNGLDLLMETYPKVATTHGHLVYRSEETKELCLNTKGLSQLFYVLFGKEKELLTKKAKENIRFPDTLLRESLVETINNDKAEVTFDFKKYRINYYKKRLHGHDPFSVCDEYFKGMLFVLRYYIDGIPDWYWFYPFHYAPFFMDMYQCVEDFDGEMTFELHKPLSPFEQLLAVLPPQSKDILPEACKQLMINEDSPIIDFYPLKFEIDLEGKRQEWEGHPILPFVDVDRLKKAYKLVENEITDVEKKRVIEGKSMKYFNDKGVIKTIPLVVTK